VSGRLGELVVGEDWADVCEDWTKLAMDRTDVWDRWDRGLLSGWAEVRDG